MDNEAMKYQLLSILSEGENDARQLSLRSNEQYQTAVAHLQSKFSQAIAIANSMEETGMRQMPSHSHRAASGSPGRSGRGSPKSDVSERTSRKRKDMLKRRVKVACTAPNNGPSDTAPLPPDDGYSWRKYGQKNILNSRNPRSYYRCTFQKSQNCPAIKHVQRSDEDPAMLDVTYQGEHTCTQHRGQTSLTQSLEQQLIIPPPDDEYNHEQQYMINFNHTGTYSVPKGTHESYQEEQGNILSPHHCTSSAQAGHQNVFSPSGTSSYGGPF